MNPSLKQDNLNLLLEAAASGDNLAREKLIEQYRPFVFKEAQRVCRRILEWGRDDELSIALIAFNEAIDAYNNTKGSSFENLCRLVIRRRLIDFFRKADNTGDAIPAEKVISQSVIEEDWEQAEREAEIDLYRKILNDFNLDFERVAVAQPSHKQTRGKLRRAAKILAGNQELMDFLYSSRNLPKRRLCELAGLTSRMLDRGRIYVIALALLLSREDLPHLRDYARELAGKGDKPG